MNRLTQDISRVCFSTRGEHDSVQLAGTLSEHAPFEILHLLAPFFHPFR
jgi:hypothetical protein